MGRPGWLREPSKLLGASWLGQKARHTDSAYQAGCWGGQGEKLQEARGGCGQAGPGARGWEGITPVHWSPGRKTSLHSSAGNSKAL